MMPRALYALLALSVATNIAFAAKFYFPGALDELLAALAGPPRVGAGDHVRGNPDAAVTVIVYTDYQCPFCARLDASMRAPEHLGRTRQIYRHLPLPSHPQAAAAAEAAECAGAQGRFWEYSEALFAAGEALAKPGAFSGLASGLSLDLKAFDRCLESGEFKQRVAEHVAQARERRIKATPTFYVNGKRFGGALANDRLRQAFYSPAP
jgi:protein-disulfide isomerase